MEIYALYIRAALPNPPNSVWKAINIRSCKKISIGGAGKGNVIVGFRIDIDTNPQDGGQIKYYSQDVSLNYKIDVGTLCGTAGGSATILR